MFESLKEKSIIKKNYNPESYIPNEIEFNKNFLKSIINNQEFLGRNYLIAMNHSFRLMENG